MTTTEVPHGIADGKPSSRVLRPPGGASSFSLGGTTAEETPLRQVSSQGRTDSPASVKPAATPAATPDNPPNEGQSQPSIAKARATSHSRIFGDSEPSAASPVSGRDLARGDGKDAGNPITGGGASQPKPQPQQQQQTPPSTRVRQPPGGFSHGIF